MQSSVYERLLEAISGFEVIDAHEHLPPEHVRVSQHVDALTLFSHYTRTDLVTSGLARRDYDRMLDGDLPLEYRWRLFSPYLEHIRYGSYARPAFIAAKEFYGFDTIDEKTYIPLSQAMAEANKPGIYHRVLREKCKIETVLTQGHRTDYDDELLVPLMPSDNYVRVLKWEDVAQRAADLKERANTLDDYIAVMEKGVEKWMSERVIGLKMMSRAYGQPSRAEATVVFERLRGGLERELPELNPLRDYLLDEMLRVCARKGLVMAVHAGMWGDFRELEPTQMMPIFGRHPETKFDLYHAGMPSVRETGVIGKNFANVWLNLCWCHIISPRMTRSALDEWMDMVPMNKIFAFGGDYKKPVEKVYGHLVMAREDIAVVLAGRVEERLMSEEEAVTVAHKWFYENPKALYGLKG